MRASALLLTALLGGACSRPTPGDTLSHRVTNAPLNPASPATNGLREATEADQLSTELLAEERTAPDTTEWSALIRRFQWKDAAARLDTLPLERLKDPLVRFARARVLSELGEWALVREHLRDLDQEIPALKDTIVDLRLTATLKVGPFAETARQLARRGDAVSQLNAAHAFREDGDPRSALGALAKVIQLSDAPSALFAEAKCLRANIAEQTGDKALARADYRWLSLRAHAACPGADQKLAELSPKLALTRRERYERALLFAKTGDVVACERELELSTEPSPQTAQAGAGISPAEIAHASGWAWFSARKDDVRAATLLDRAATLGVRDALRDRFYAARAWARAREHERALKQYDALGRQLPRSTFGEQSVYLAARLRHMMGQVAAAKAGYQTYLARYGKRGRHFAEANYELAVAELAGGSAVEAGKAFSHLARNAPKERLAERYRELEAVASAKAGQKDLAVRQFEQVIEERPLSFAALASAAHIQALTGESRAPLGEVQDNGPRPPAFGVPVPTKVALLMALGLDTDAEKALREHEPSFRRMYGARAGEALCGAYGELSVATRRYVIGQDAARRDELQRAPPPARRWLWDCVYPRPHRAFVSEVEKSFGLPRHLVYAIMRQESSFRPYVVSPANAVGLMQLLPATAERVASELGVPYLPEELKNPHYNIQLGARYLRKLLDMFGHMVPAVAAYNAGPHAVSHWLESGETLPADVFAARIPYTETRDYVYRVLGNLARYAYVEDGVAAVPELVLDLPRGKRADADAY